MSEEDLSHYLCIGCPLGCRLDVETSEAGEVTDVRNWGCKTGQAYGRQEHTDPRRHIATSVRITGSRWGRVPVKTSGTIPKHMVKDVARAVQVIEVEAPIKIGTIVLADVLGTGIDVVTTRDMERM
jgi:CxxC motif-containing protein